MSIEAISSETNNYERLNNAYMIRQPASGTGPSFNDTMRSSATVSSGSADLDAIFERAGRIYNISPDLLKAVAKVESNFHPNAVSRAGAMGIMQLMPGTAAGLGVTNAFDPEQNIMGGARYLRQMLDRFDGDVRAALSAYNAGPGRVSRNGGEALSFTEGYVNKVLSNFHGGSITAGTVSYGRYFNDVSYTSADSGDRSWLSDFAGSLPQMLLMKIIEMQMNSISDDKNDVNRIV